MWSKISNGINESAINCIVPSQENPNTVFIGSDRNIYKTTNAGRYFEPVMNSFGDLSGVNDIYISEQTPQNIFAATDEGLFLSLDNGEKWNKIYESLDRNSRACRSVIEFYDAIYLGTLRGLFSKSKTDPRWQREQGILGDDAIYKLGKDEDYLYIATAAQLFRLDKSNRTIKKIFTLAYGDEEAVEDFSTGEESESIKKLKDFCVIENGGAGGEVYVAGTSGIYKSRDHGGTWQRLSSNGLPVKEITAITVTRCGEDFCVLAGTKKGVFILRDGQWLSLYKGMEANNIRFLTHDSMGRIYAATDRGAFVCFLQPNPTNPTNSTTPINYSKISERFSVEPSIFDIHRMAIDYAEVHPDKITNWRNLAKKRAWLPKLSIGVDQNKNKTTSDSLWGSYSSGGQHYVGPDDKTFYDNFGWDVSLSWELADLIWSTDQTTIDSRSKYTVELREDILDQVTRLFFERRRLQVELLSESDVPPAITFEQEMRVEELTALIDAFTGGGFSRKISE